MTKYTIKVSDIIKKFKIPKHTTSDMEEVEITIFIDENCRIEYESK